MKLELFKNKLGKWQWRIVASNGKILCHSEEYSRKDKVLHTAMIMARKLEINIKELI